MNTALWAMNAMQKKGWKVMGVSYERPRSGFKCVEGGWLLTFDTEDCYEQIDEIFFDPKINGTIDSTGVIMAMTAPDFRKLINKIPVQNPDPSNH